LPSAWMMLVALFTLSPIWARPCRRFLMLGFGFFPSGSWCNDKHFNRAGGKLRSG
jgi:hypothetical protein